MQIKVATILAFSATIGNVFAASGCHKKDDDIGRTCQYKDKDAWRNAARLYCWMFSTPLTVPGGNSGSNVYQLKISNVPDGYGGQQIFWGNYKVNGGTHRITFDECMKYQEGNYCDGFGGWTDTDFGTVFGECIR
ncbi:hypothetical protein BS50DRAFT_580112, partial [Corynespora cassiicola Philippines]